MELWDPKKINRVSDSEGKAIYSKIVKDATSYRHASVKNVKGRAL